MRKKLGVILMTAGILCVAAAAALLIHNNNENKNAEVKSSAVMSSLMSVIEAETTNPSLEKDPFDTEMLTVSIDGYDYIGYLFIPCLELELPIMAECDDERLETAPCRYYGSSKTDNLVIAAHNYRSHFGYLGKLEIGSAISFTDMEGEKKSYIVTSVEILPPSDSDKVKDTGDDLILYTCTYRGVSRIVVRCSEI